jgi:UDP-glucuronate decarboxylase
MMDEIIIKDLENILNSIEKDFFKGKNFLVTGGAGFIGSWICDALIKLNANVTCLDNLSSGKNENIDHLFKYENFKFINKDVTKYSGEENKRYDYILHLASRASPEEYQKYPIETILANSLGSLNMLELARKNNSIILFSSTSEIYGDAKIIPTPEEYWGNVNPIGPRSCYDESKRFSEALFIAYQKQYGLDTRILRIFNTYGPRIRADGFYARVIPRFIIQALNNKDITVYGNGTQTRSFCYISDTIEAIILTIYKKEAKNEVINIGNPKEIKIIEIAEKIKLLTKSNSKIIFKPLPPDDPKRRCPDISKAKKILNWYPKIELDEGLIKTIQWFIKFLPISRI